MKTYEPKRVDNRKEAESEGRRAKEHRRKTKALADALRASGAGSREERMTKDVTDFNEKFK